MYKRNMMWRKAERLLTDDTECVTVQLTKRELEILEAMVSLAIIRATNDEADVAIEGLRLLEEHLEGVRG